MLENGWRVFVRPMRDTDEELIGRFLPRIDKADLRLRFFATIKEFSHPFLVSLTHLDPTKAMAFIAFDEQTSETLGVVRVHRDLETPTGEYAILLNSSGKGHGLGWALMHLIIEYARSVGLAQMTGQVMRENILMLKICREIGFTVHQDMGDQNICHVSLTL